MSESFMPTGGMMPLYDEFGRALPDLDFAADLRDLLGHDPVDILTRPPQLRGLICHQPGRLPMLTWGEPTNLWVNGGEDGGSPLRR